MSALQVLLERRQAVPDARLVLTLHQATGEAEQAAELVVHLVAEPRAAPLGGVEVGPGALERTVREAAGGQPGSIPGRVLEDQLDLEATWQLQVVADPGPGPRRSAEGLGRAQVGHPPRGVGQVLVDGAPDPLGRHGDGDLLADSRHAVIVREVPGLRVGQAAS